MIKYSHIVLDCARYHAGRKHILNGVNSAKYFKSN